MFVAEWWGLCMPPRVCAVRVMLDGIEKQGLPVGYFPFSMCVYL